MINFQSGALLDVRPESEKLCDYSFRETVAKANAVNWIEKQISEWRKFPIYDQDGSGSCVAQTMRKLLTILYWLKYGVIVDFSASDIYGRRANKPGTGMSGIDVFKIAQEGVTLNLFAPSDGMNDAQMDAVKIEKFMREVGDVFKIGNYLMLPVGDVETIASVIQTTGKGVMIWTFWNYDEYNEAPQIIHPELTPSVAQGIHSVAAVDFTLYQGEKALVIDDSWNKTFGFNGQRVIRESFLKKRNFFAAYPMNFAFEGLDGKPVHKFEKDLKFIPLDSSGEISNVTLNEYQKADVIALQDILKYEKFMASNIQSTGYFGSITAEAVYKYQTAHGVASQAELDSLKGRVVGPATRTSLNKNYK